MRVTTLILPLLPALALANTPPYQRVYDEFKARADAAYQILQDILPSTNPDSYDPIDAGAAKVAGQVVERVNIRNFQRKLAPKLEGEEEWLVYFTGGNRSCFGRCGPVDVVWNESVPLLAALPQTPSAPTLHLARVDCEKDAVLCTALTTSLPAIWHFNLPRKTSPQAKSPLHIVPLNISTTTVSSITSIPDSTKARYKDYNEYTGSGHPVDGWLAQTGLLVPLGYLLWGIGSTPSWLVMIGVSFVSRQIMSKRMAGGTAGGWGTAPAQGAGVPGAQGPASPRQGGGAAAPRGGAGTGKMGKKNK